MKSCGARTLPVLCKVLSEAIEMTTSEVVLSLSTDPLWRPLLEELSLLLADLTHDSRYKDRMAYISALLADPRFPN
jgi:hypothetical protein